MSGYPPKPAMNKDNQPAPTTPRGSLATKLRHGWLN
jgi:hypothetical protein